MMMEISPALLSINFWGRLWGSLLYFGAILILTRRINEEKIWQELGKERQIYTGKGMSLQSKSQSEEKEQGGWRVKRSSVGMSQEPSVNFWPDNTQNAYLFLFCNIYILEAVLNKHMLRFQKHYSFFMCSIVFFFKFCHHNKLGL